MHSCCSASFKPTWREHTAWHGRWRATRQIMCSFLSNAVEHVIISAKWKKKKTSSRGEIVAVLTALLALVLERAVDRKSSAGHILCLSGVIYEAWNCVLWRSRHSTVTTRRSESEEGGRAAHNKGTWMQTGRYMYRQKYSRSKTLCHLRL